MNFDALTLQLFGFEIAAALCAGLVCPLVGGFLPASFQESAGKYFPAQAGMAVFSVNPDPQSLAPWTGFAVFLGFVSVAMGAAALLLARRDA